MTRLAFFFSGFFAALVATGVFAGEPLVPTVRVVPIGVGNQPYVELLSGPPQTVVIRSGAVTLAPGKSVGVHSTANFEEVLVPLEGEGELRLAGKPPLHVKPGFVFYTPPETAHDVVNTGRVPLRYLFIVARVR